MSEKSRNIALAFAFGAALGASACATPPTDPLERQEFEQTNDPFEPANREIFDFNLFLDRILIKPLAEAYRAVVPEPARTAVRNFLRNLNEPVVFTNNLLQGQFKRADHTFGRFLFNTTFGIGGLMDPATGQGLPEQTGDFGQTLYSWGVPDGPYIVIPVLGPSNVRDGIGLGVDSFLDPWFYVASNNHVNYITYARFGATGIDRREQNLDTLDELQKNALDFYAELRSLVRQHRAQQLRNNEPNPGMSGSGESLYVDPAKEQAAGR